MRTSALVAAILPLAVTAAPAADVQERGLIGNVICLANRIMVNALLSNPIATPYCAVIAGVPSVALTKVVTQTLPAVTVTVPINANLPALTITSALTQTVNVDAILPTSTVNLSCLNSAFKAPTTALGKRSVVVTVPKPTELATVADNLISTLCSCLSLPTQTNTVLSTKTLAASTVTVSANVARATSTVLSTVTVTATSAVGAAASGVNGAAAAVVTALVPGGGFTYKKYTHSFGTSDSGPAFSANTIKALTPDWTGSSPVLNFATDYWPTFVNALLTLDRPSSWDASQAAMVFTGYFVAPKTGTYTLSAAGNSIDNWGYLWTGDNALNWNDSNTAFKATRLDSGSTDGTTTLVMNAGDAVPITWLWANGGSSAKSELNIAGPDGLITDLVNSIVKPCSA